MPEELTNSSPMLCPICRYDCRGVDSDKCSECGATLVRSFKSPNVFVPSAWHLRLLVVLSYCLFIIVLLTGVSREARHEILDQQQKQIEHFQQNFMDYEGRQIQWWNKFRSGAHVGMVPQAPRQPSSTITPANDEFLRAWLGALWKDAPEFAPIIILTGLPAIVVLWISFAQRRRPILPRNVRAGSLLLYMYVFLMLFLIVINVVDLLSY